MSFIETPRFPDRISYGALSGIETSTEVVTTMGGAEIRNRNWAESRRTFDLALNARAFTEMNQINAYFEACHGKTNGFRIRDWSDFSATAELCLQLTSTTFQLRKAYAVGSITQYRTIRKPSTAKIYVGGVLQTTGYTLDSTTGIITFAPAPGAAVTWTGEFDVPVRFDQDILNWSVFDRRHNGGELLFNAQSLTATEIK